MRDLLLHEEDVVLWPILAVVVVEACLADRSQSADATPVSPAPGAAAVNALREVDLWLLR